MKIPFVKSTKESVRLAALVAALMEKSANLANRLSDAHAAAEAATIARNQNLATASETELDALMAKAASTEATISALKPTLQEVDRQLAQARLDHAQAVQNERRADEADALEAVAKQVDQNLQTVAAAAAALKKAIGGLVKVVPEGLAIWPNWDRPDRATTYGAAGASDVTSALVAEIAYSVHPDAVVWDFWRGNISLYDIAPDSTVQPQLRHQTEGRKPVSIADAGKYLISDRLNILAQELRGGIENAKIVPVGPSEKAKPAQEIEILVTKAFKYRTMPTDLHASGLPQYSTLESRKKAWVQKPIADAAIAADCAILADTEHANGMLNTFLEQNRRSQNAWRTDAEDVIDLGDPLKIETTFQPSTQRFVA